MEYTQDQWNTFVHAHNGTFLQSWEWGELQKSLGKKIVRIAHETFVALCIRNKFPFGKHYFYTPHGPVLKNNDTAHFSFFLSAAEKELIPHSKKQMVFLRIDPNLSHSDATAETLRTLGFHSTYDAQPQWTRILDLAKPDDVILNEMVAETRYAIRTAEKRGVTILRYDTSEQKEKHFDAFWKIFLETMQRSELTPHSEAYFRRLIQLQGTVQTELVLAQIDNKTIAADIFLYFGNTATYLYAGSLRGYGRYNAPSLLLWDAIRNAKQRGYTAFDLWGISYEKKKWGGITAFKKGFGGKEVYYLGAWDFPLRPAWYILYYLYKKIF